jgi:uncharacterized protein (TIGR02271 family)
MSKQQRIPVVGDDGLIGYLIDAPPGSGPVEVRLSNGRKLTVPASELHQQGDGAYYLPLSGAESGSASAAKPAGDEAVVPVVEEQVVVEKRPVAKGRVRVHKKIDERHETVDLPLTKERVEIRRVVIDRDVDDFLPVRREGDTTIIPIVEEVLVVEKKLRLKEEIHVIRRREQERHVEEVALKQEHAEIERVDEEGCATRVAPERETGATLGRAAARGYVRKNKVVK